MKIVKYLVKFAGIALIIAGWFLANHEQYPFVYKVVAPKYANAVDAYNRMYEKDFILKQGDVGFAEISDILKTHITGEEVPIITKVRTIDWGTGFGQREKSVSWRQFIELEISFSDAPPVRGNFHEWKEQIEQTYLTGTIFAWRNVLFWTGIVIASIS